MLDRRLAVRAVIVVVGIEVVTHAARVVALGAGPLLRIRAVIEALRADEVRRALYLGHQESITFSTM
jgi:hypothetical protein